MDPIRVRWLRLAVVAGAIAGSALVSSAVMATDEAPPIEAAPIEEPVADEPPADPPASAPAADVGDPGEQQSIVVELPPEVPLDDIAVIEFTVDADPAVVVAPDPDVVEPAAAPLEHAVMASEPEGGEGGSGGSEHEGGSGQGTPYLMTFEVDWFDTAGDAIDLVASELPLGSFELTADSQTGHGMPTSATCTYTAGSVVLECVFDNPGHGSESDGLVVPARPTATYTVTVEWPETNWTIEGANDGAQSARALCPRGGGGQGGGHEATDGGHEGTSGGEGGEGGEEGRGGEGGGGGERTTFACVHTVKMRKAAMPPPEPPPVTPEAQPILPSEPVVTVAPTTAAQVASSPVAQAAGGTLPTTGSSISLLLVLAGLLVLTGAAVAWVSRRTPTPLPRDEVL